MAALCVMGGIFSEGIDLKEERLIGAVIIGTGLPQVNTEQEILKEYFDEHGEHGFDYVKRCDKILKDYEAKLHLVAKFIKVKEIAGELERLSDECIRTRDMALIDQIRRLSAEITSTL